MDPLYQNVSHGSEKKIISEAPSNFHIIGMNLLPLRSSGHFPSNCKWECWIEKLIDILIINSLLCTRFMCNISEEKWIEEKQLVKVWYCLMKEKSNKKKNNLLILIKKLSHVLNISITMKHSSCKKIASGIRCLIWKTPKTTLKNSQLNKFIF